MAHRNEISKKKVGYGNHQPRTPRDVPRNPAFVQFGALDEYEIAKFCSVQITNLYSPETTNFTGTVYDEKMGTIENNKTCVTCGFKNTLCPGHFGYIQLSQPVFNCKFIRHVRNILLCICWSCGSCRITSSLFNMKVPGNLHRLSKQRFLIGLCQKKTECPSCSAILYQCYEDKQDCKIRFIKENARKSSRDEELSAERIYHILKKVTPETMRMMGYNEDLATNSVFYSNDIIEREEREHLHIVKPTAFMFYLLPVLPPCARPWTLEGGVKHDDKITLVYNAILSVNIKLDNAKKGIFTERTRKSTSAENIIRKYSDELQNLVNSIVDNSKDRNDSNFFSRRSPHISIKDRIIGKKGRIQANISGKHTDFCARNVIASGYAAVESGYIGLSEDTMNNLLVKVNVTRYNYEEANRLVHKGIAVNVIREGSIISLKYATNGYTIPFKLRIGDVLERRLMNDDVVATGRQPTLRQESLMGVLIKRIPNSLPIRIPLSMCTALNADFDGDEMHFQVPQHIMAVTECKTILNYTSKIITPQKNSPIIGLIQDSLVALYILSQREIERNIFFDCISSITSFCNVEERELSIEQAKVAVHRFFRREKTEKERIEFLDVLFEAPYPRQRELLKEVEKVYGEDFLFPRRYRYETRDTFSRLGNLLKRAKKHYPKQISKTSSGDYKLAEVVDGKLLISFLLPESLHFEKETQSGRVVIEKGVILPSSSPLDKKIVGVSGNSLTSLLCANYSNEMARKFISEAEQLSYRYISSQPISVGIGDFLISEEYKEKIKEEIEKTKYKCEIIIEENSSFAEAKINAELNSLMNISTSLASEGMEKKRDNSMNIMRLCGAKGSAINCFQISAFVGQQNVDGERAKLSLREERAIPCMFPGDQSPESRGFITSCYLEGLSPSETFFHAQAGRRGIVDTSLKTSTVGYSSKNLEKKMNDYKIDTDGTVRNSADCIIQFLYGGDGFDCAKLTNVSYSKTPLFCDILSLSKSISGLSEAKGKKKIPNNMIDSFLLAIKVGQPGFQTEIHRHSASIYRKLLRPILKKVEIERENIRPFFRKLLDLFEQSKVAYGEMVGLSAASSISEPTVQMVLSSFHNTGLGSKDITVSGVPRMSELLGANLVPSICSTSFLFKDRRLEEIYKEVDEINKKLNSNSFDGSREELISQLREKKVECIEICEKFGKSLERLFLKDVCESWEVSYYNHTPKDFPFDIFPDISSQWKPQWWNLFYDIPKEACWVIKFKINMELLFEHSIELFQVEEAIRNTCEDETTKILDVHVSPNSLGEIILFFSKENILEVADISERNHDFFICKDELVPMILLTQIKGIRGVEATYYKEDLVSKKFSLSAKGDCFSELFTTPGIEQCSSSNMRDILERLGIEATRCYLMEEFTRIISFDGNYINPHHIELLVDSMLVYGTISSVKSFGIGRESGPIPKALYERNLDNLIYSASFGESDNLRSISSNVMMGILSEAGLGSVYLVSDRSSDLSAIKQSSGDASKRST